MQQNDKTGKNERATDHEGTSQSGDFDAKTPIGDAWIDDKQTIHINLRRTADGRNISGTKEYLLGDKYYDEVMKHIGGLKPGEVKLVLPWPEK